MREQQHVTAPTADASLPSSIWPIFHRDRLTHTPHALPCTAGTPDDPALKKAYAKAFLERIAAGECSPSPIHCRQDALLATLIDCRVWPHVAQKRVDISDLLTLWLYMHTKVLLKFCFAEPRNEHLVTHFIGVVVFDAELACSRPTQRAWQRWTRKHRHRRRLPRPRQIRSSRSGHSARLLAGQRGSSQRRKVSRRDASEMRKGSEEGEEKQVHFPALGRYRRLRNRGACCAGL